MGLDIWFAEDIRNALLAANEASASTAAVIAEVGTSPGMRQDSPANPVEVGSSADLLAVTMRAYREGYKAALATVALAFGIAPQTIGRREPREIGQSAEEKDRGPERHRRPPPYQVGE